MIFATFSDTTVLSLLAANQCPVVVMLTGDIVMRVSIALRRCGVKSTPTLIRI
ncbi:hypothetical protein AZE42_14135 [Rhizopogon vesiculosus]|uniref:Uncharacterized protein n=1 Tax=Rhizopogon vesiculosus TaxID=180088 RepID=A0A1J8QI88_9AGAM|nr:hypothetical protein AZE42_14135 [Rhizopogon vesiculosus]